MAVVGEWHDDVAVSVRQAAARYVGVHENQIAAVSRPVDRGYEVAVKPGFALPYGITGVVVQVDDAVMSPVRCYADFKPGVFGNVVADADALRVADVFFFQDFTVVIGKYKPLRTRNEPDVIFAHYDLVRVVVFNR